MAPARSNRENPDPAGAKISGGWTALVHPLHPLTLMIPQERQDGPDQVHQGGLGLMMFVMPGIC